MKRMRIVYIRQRLPRILISGCLLICACILLLSCSSTQIDDPALSTVRIRYETPFSGEVQLVWGIEKWKIVDEAYRPQGTYIKDNVMHTPMTYQGDAYVIVMSLPKGGQIRYGFLLIEDSLVFTDNYWDKEAVGTHLLEKSDEEIYVKSSRADIDLQSRPEYVGVFPEYTYPSLYNLILAPTIATGLTRPILIIIIVIVVILITVVVLRKISALTFVLLIILVIGAALRLQWIEQPYVDAFGWRETSTAMMAENYFKTNGNILYPEVNWSGPGPNYQGREFQTVSYLAAILYRFLGQQDWIGRSVAVVFGLWGIFALYKLVALAWDKRAAIVAAAIMAILPASIFVERSFLPDPAMVALMTTSLWLFVLYLKSDRLIILILAAIVGAFGALTKLPGLIIGLPALYAMVVLLPKKPKPWRRLLLIGLVGVLVLIPVILYYLWARNLSLKYPPYHFAGGTNWIWNHSVASWLGENYFISKLAWLANNWLWTIPVLVLSLIGFGFLLFSWWVNYKDADLNYEYDLPLIFHWWLVAGAVYYAIGAKELIQNPWNLHILTPALAALAAMAFIVILRIDDRRNWAPASIVVVTGILILIFGIGFNNNLKKLYRSSSYDDYLLGLRLSELSKPGDLVVTTDMAYGSPINIFYSRRRGWVYPQPDHRWISLFDDQEAAIQELEKFRKEGADWLGFEKERKEQFWRDYPQLSAHIEQSSFMVDENDEYVIFRFKDIVE